MLSTAPADRPAAEAAISGLYQLAGHPPPRFHWVPSPFAALHTRPPGHRDGAEDVADLDSWPVVRALRHLVTGFGLAADAALRPGHVTADRLLRPMLHVPLNATQAAVHDRILRAADDDPYAGGRGWYTALAAPWAAHHDTLCRLAGLHLAPDLRRLLDLWTAAARSTGPWWPRQRVCVVAERPVELHTEPADRPDAVRLHRADGPAVRYADGWALHAWHGTTVPAWVIDDPDPGRIGRERNAEVRRCAIERIGWARYLDEAGLALLATAPDPGNPGAELRLYDLGRDGTRVLLAVNGSVERDGRRRRYGLTVPEGFTDPVAAAAWTYGLARDEYATLTRRT